MKQRHFNASTPSSASRGVALLLCLLFSFLPLLPSACPTPCAETGTDACCAPKLPPPCCSDCYGTPLGNEPETHRCTCTFSKVDAVLNLEAPLVPPQPQVIASRPSLLAISNLISPALTSEARPPTSWAAHAGASPQTMFCCYRL